MSNNGNSKDIIGEKIGGDGDDYILGEIGIPSVTAELGTEGQYFEEWQNKDSENALKICEDNSQYLEFTYQKLGGQLSIVPDKYVKLNDQFIRVFLNVTNKGLSDFQNVQVSSPPQSSLTQLSFHDDDEDSVNEQKVQVDDGSTSEKKA